MLSVDVEDTIKKLEGMNARKILLQLPDGLKPHAFDYFNSLSAKFSVIISSDPFYGACDVGNAEIYKDVDCIVQYGHSEIPNVKYPKSKTAKMDSSKEHTGSGGMFSVRRRDTRLKPSA